MTIRINQIAVDFTLEKERTFADLTTSLRAWANGQDLAVIGILADGKALGPDDATPLDEIRAVEVEAVPAGQRDLARVAVIARFFSLLAQGAQGGDQALVSELHQEFGSVRSALFPLLSPVAPRILGALEVLDGPWNDPAVLKQAAAKLAHEAEGLRRELQAPGAALSQSLDSLEFSLTSLEALAGLFQKGRDREGFDLILQLFTVLEDLGRQAPQAALNAQDDLASWVRFHAELHPLLKEAEAALNTGDYVLLTDLLEYEVSPRLKTVRGLFSQTLQLDPANELL